jgi:uncharacterized protein (DUF697 family)
MITPERMAELRSEAFDEVAKERQSQSGVSPAANAPATNAPAPPLTTEQKADAIIKKYVFWAAGAGLLPIPVVDIVGIAVAQSRMLDELYKVYYVPPNGAVVPGNGTTTSQTLIPNPPQNHIQNLVTVIVASAGPAALLTVPLRNALKFIPLIGSLPAAGAQSALGGISTYVVGKLVQEQLKMTPPPASVAQALDLALKSPDFKEKVRQIAAEAPKIQPAK